MKIASRCLPLGALPYENIESATKMIAKLFDKLPYIALFPKIEKEDSVLKQTLENIPGIEFKSKRIYLKAGTKAYTEGLLQLDKAFNSPSKENLEPYAINSHFFEKYLQIIKKFKSPNAVVNLTGRFTISQLLNSAAEEQMLADKSFRKLFIQSVCIKALWAIEQIKAVSPTTVPIIILEEPMLGQLGNIKRENEEVTVDLVTNMFAKVIEKIKAEGAIVGIQCMEKCDWKIPINAGIDLISFDAYNNPNNLCIIPEKVTEFLERGGKINWGIVPVMTESIIKSSNIDFVFNRFTSTLESLILAGVSARLVYNSALVSIQGDVDKLPIIFAEKAIILATQLAKRIPFLK